MTQSELNSQVKALINRIDSYIDNEVKSLPNKSSLHIIGKTEIANWNGIKGKYFNVGIITDKSVIDI